MSWAGLTREINAQFAGVEGARSLATGTIKGLSHRAIVEGDGVLQVLCWLGRSPESFLVGRPTDGSGEVLPVLPADRILRWDTRALYHALDKKRQLNGLNWTETADAIGGVNAAGLARLKKGGRATFPLVMRIVVWLNEPAARFTRSSER